MNPAIEHHDLALKLLVGRSLPNGLPWSIDEDKAMVIQERLLWARMTPEEQAAEQASLAELWQKRGAERLVNVNLYWGKWASKLPATVNVTDAAFGLPAQGYLPWTKGPYTGAPEALQPVMQWLWLRGYQIVDLDPKGTAVMVIPSHRQVQESERLMGLIAGLPGMDKCLSPVGGQGGGSKITLQAKYDPVGGVATLEMTNVALLIGKTPVPKRK